MEPNDSGIGETVQILLERMKSNPEEFFSDTTKNTPSTYNRFQWVVNTVLAIKTGQVDNAVLRSHVNYLTPAELDALYEGYRVIRRQCFHEEIMKVILGTDEPEEVQQARPRSTTKNTALGNGYGYGYQDPHSAYHNTAANGLLGGQAQAMNASMQNQMYEQYALQQEKEKYEMKMRAAMEEPGVFGSVKKFMGY